MLDSTIEMKKDACENKMRDNGNRSYGNISREINLSMSLTLIADRMRKDGAIDLKRTKIRG